MTAMHPSISNKAVHDMIRRQQTTLDNTGACAAYGTTYEDVEPDAADHECEHCGEAKICGCETIVPEGPQRAGCPNC
jgi:hypothetical protein